MDVIEYVLGEEEEFGLKAISIVDTPAIGEHFIMLAKQEKMMLAKVADEQVLVGALLIPDQRIYRRDDTGYEFEMFVSAETITKLSRRFMQQEHQNEITLQHEDKLINIGVREMWLVADPKKDKSAVYGFDYPVGTLMAAVHVEDKSQWESLKDSDVKGFSVEMMLKPKEDTNLSVIEMLHKVKG